MAPTYPLTFKNCSTCKYWEGEREFSDDKSQVQISSSTNTGCCKNSPNEEKQAYMSCEKWSS